MLLFQNEAPGGCHQGLVSQIFALVLITVPCLCNSSLLISTEVSDVFSTLFDLPERPNPQLQE